ncbi:hypothetical protein [Cryobacterium sp. AP23]
MSMLAEIMLALASIVVISTVSVIVLARVLIRRIRRSRTVTSSVLRTRALVSVGRQHEVHTLRLRLADTLASGRAALDLAGSNGSQLGELHRLYDRIRSDATTLDAQLLLLLSERDAVVLAESIPVAGRRVDQVAWLVRRLRSAVAAGLGDRTDDSLAALTDDLDREIVALDAGLRELHTLNGREPRSVINPFTGRSES